MAATTNEIEHQLAWEAAWRMRAAVAAAVGGVALLAGTAILQFAVFANYPAAGLLQVLSPALQGQSDFVVDPRSAGVVFVSHHGAGAIASGAVTGVGLALVAVVLFYLYRATVFRRPQTPPLTRVLAIAGPATIAVMTIAGQVATVLAAHRFANGHDLSRHAVEHLFVKSGLITAVGWLTLPAKLAFVFALILVSINAMRAGLLTRFMGVLGCICAVLFVIPIAGRLPVVQAFWLVALGVLISGRAPNGSPTAWSSAKAEPWPTQRELREAREAAASAPQEPATPPSSADPDTPAPAPAHPVSKKRRRKRR